jgi:alpha,alpha-trehalase
MIKDYFWDGLTRTMDEEGIQSLIHDSKNATLISNKLRIYVSSKDEFAFQYYKELETTFPIEVFRLPGKITPEYVKSINDKPGILSLKLRALDDKISGAPFVVPGGRFNEMYGWDSYFESVGLIIDGKVELAKAMADNFQYEIEHYGKILNANRSYYLTRTQPPLYTSLIREVYEVTENKEWLLSHLETALKEYETVWMVQGKRFTKNGLNRYLAEGIGITPEAEEGHYDAVLKPYADKAALSNSNYEKAYSEGKIANSDLDSYFTHDRTVRESGHDTSYRIEGNCADLNLVELNAMLFKYETDFAELIKIVFGDKFKANNKTYTSSYFIDKANERKELVDKFLWNSEKGLYFDYNFKTESQSSFISATTFAPLWCKMASPKQAKSLVDKGLPLLKEKGGIAGSTKESRGVINASRPHRQWDYPNGWAPHQMMIWKGLLNYNFKEEAQELIYRWLFMITKNAVDYNGTIPEKYDVVDATHKVFSEYGNVGTDFEYISLEGFGWMNASYQYGLSLLDQKLLKKLNDLDEPDSVFLI